VGSSAVTFALTALVVACHLSPITSSLFVGTRAEGILILILAAFWAATVSIVTNASNNLGVSDEGIGNADFQANQVLNGNLYYFSWAGFVTSIVLLVNYLQVAFGVDVVGEARNRGARFSLWAGMLAAALVVMGSAARVKNQDCSPNLDEPSAYCKRTKFAISLGAIGVVASLAVLGSKLLNAAVHGLIENGSAFLLAVLNAFGVAYITSAKGPGSAIGNLYYFSWISFLCSAFLAAECFNQQTGGVYAEQARNAWNGTPPASPNKNTRGGDIEVQDLPDDQHI
jgi:hypothetical protein